jgi:heme/copper-type cytochrome/quinol oxidase subunit 3
MSTAASGPLARAQGVVPIRGRAGIDTGVVGMSLFLFSEAMFFAGLVSAFVILRTQNPAWPPPGQPRLPVGVSTANTVVLLFSGYAMWRALRAAGGAGKGVAAWLGGAALTGALFLAIQGFEWARLLEFGLSSRAGVYGATFYAVVGIHGAHVLAALIVLLLSWRRAARGGFTPTRHGGLTLCAMLWLFVVGVWPILFALLYEPWRG